MAVVQLLDRHEVDAAIIVGCARGARGATAALRRPVPPGLAGSRRRPRAPASLFRPVSLKRGSVDPRRDLPLHDIRLLATTANLVVRDDLHPALAYLLLEAARKVHRQPTLINRADEFSESDGDRLPAVGAGGALLQGRPAFLQSYLPFWVAINVQRLILLLVPLATILLPLVQGVPRFVEWRRRSRQSSLRRAEASGARPDLTASR